MKYIVYLIALLCLTGCPPGPSIAAESIERQNDISREVWDLSNEGYGRTTEIHRIKFSDGVECVITIGYYTAGKGIDCNWEKNDSH